MSEKILVLLIGLLGGISVGIQSPIAGALGQRPEGIVSSVLVRLSGLILSVTQSPCYVFGGGDILVDSGSDHYHLYQTLLNFANRPEHLKFDEVAVYYYNLSTQSSLLSA